MTVRRQLYPAGVDDLRKTRARPAAESATPDRARRRAVERIGVAIAGRRPRTKLVDAILHRLGIVDACAGAGDTWIGRAAAVAETRNARRSPDGAEAARRTASAAGVALPQRAPKTSSASDAALSTARPSEDVENAE